MKLQHMDYQKKKQYKKQAEKVSAYHDTTNSFDENAQTLKQFNMDGNKQLTGKEFGAYVDLVFN